MKTPAPGILDSIGAPADDLDTLSRIHRRWGITYAESLDAFRSRAAFLIEARS